MTIWTEIYKKISENILNKNYKFQNMDGLLFVSIIEQHVGIEGERMVKRVQEDFSRITRSVTW